MLFFGGGELRPISSYFQLALDIFIVSGPTMAAAPVRQILPWTHKTIGLLDPGKLELEEIGHPTGNAV